MAAQPAQRRDSSEPSVTRRRGRRQAPSIAGILWSLAFAGGLGAGPLAAETALYTVRFAASWSAASHPRDFPANAHFSPLVGGTHAAGLELWRPGGLASPGIEQMAEMGLVQPLVAEVRAGIARGLADQELTGAAIAQSPGETTLSFSVDSRFPLVTLVSMLAPSPDWFVGVHGLSLRERGDWVQEKVVHLLAYDAGTDSGTTFRSPDADTVPRRPIAVIDRGPLAEGSYVGTFTFTRTDSTPPPPLLLQEGRFAVRAMWEDSGGSRGFAQAVPLTEDSGTFWFFNANNVELLVKVLDACGGFDRFWVFAAGLTNLGVELTVEDLESGVLRTWRSPPGEPYAPLQDTAAFATCP